MRNYANKSDSAEPTLCERIIKVRRRGHNVESIIAVDDTPKKLEQSYGNLIRVNPFQGDLSDLELQALLILLYVTA